MCTHRLSLVLYYLLCHKILLSTVYCCCRFDVKYALWFRKIFAFDREASRLSTMRALLKKSGVDCVSVTLQDFLRVSPYDPKYKDVKYMLVDPSCSGSGETGNNCGLYQTNLKHFYLPNPSHQFNFSPCNLCTVS